MSATAVLPPPSPRRPTPRISSVLNLAMLHRLTVEDFHRMIDAGVFRKDERVELIDGYLVQKMSHKPPHDGSLFALQDYIIKVLGIGWVCRVQSAITLSESEPEPDLAIVRGDARTYFTRHPNALDFGIAIEVSDSSLGIDRTDKLAMYSRNGVPEYWIVNIPERQIEVYASPQSSDLEPHYAVRTDYGVGQSVPIALDGRPIAAIPVAEVLP